MSARPPRRREVTTAKQAVADALAWNGVEAEVRAHRVVTEWKQIVGERIGARAWPDGLTRAGVRDQGAQILWVRVISSAWLHELTLLRAQLARPELDQLMQRVVAMCHLQPLSAAETGAYVGHRLERAGWCGDPDLEEGALALVYKEARGLPRRINMLMDRLLLLACLEQRHRIDRALAEEMILDLREEGLGPAAVVREVDR